MSGRMFKNANVVVSSPVSKHDCERIVEPLQMLVEPKEDAMKRPHLLTDRDALHEARVINGHS